MLSTRTYAQALFEVGVVRETALQYYDELIDFKQILHDQSITKVFRLAPMSEDLNAIWDILQSVYSLQVVNFIRILYDANLLKFYTRIVEAYQEILEDNGYLRIVSISTPSALDHESQLRIESMLEKDSTVRMLFHYSNDPSLIAGMVVQNGNDIYDTSIKSKLDRIMSQGGQGV